MTLHQIKLFQIATICHLHRIAKGSSKCLIYEIFSAGQIQQPASCTSVHVLCKQQVWARSSLLQERSRISSTRNAYLKNNYLIDYPQHQMTTATGLPCSWKMPSKSAAIWKDFIHSKTDRGKLDIIILLLVLLLTFLLQLWSPARPTWASLKCLVWFYFIKFMWINVLKSL